MARLCVWLTKGPDSVCMGVWTQYERGQRGNN